MTVLLAKRQLLLRAVQRRIHTGGNTETMALVRLHHRMLKLGPYGDSLVTLGRPVWKPQMPQPCN
jgi:hypothetical protein